METKEKVTLYTLYGTERGEIVDAVRKAVGAEPEVIVCSGSLRHADQFPFIKDEKGRPYYGEEGIEVYLKRKL